LNRTSSLNQFVNSLGFTAAASSSTFFAFPLCCDITTTSLPFIAELFGFLGSLAAHNETN
jgi:hypothetical protein